MNLIKYGGIYHNNIVLQKFIYTYFRNLLIDK